MTQSAVTDPDRPAWEEPRGPHLPDALVAVPALAWPLLLLAVWLGWSEWTQGVLEAARTSADVVFPIASAIEVVTAPLLGVALLLRHPAAWSRLPMVLFGIVLLVAHALLQQFEQGIRDLVLGVSADPIDPVAASPVSLAVQLAPYLVQALGLLYIARGLATARQRAHAARSMTMLAVLVAAGLLNVGVTLWFFAGSVAAVADQLPTVLATLVASTTTWLAWAYLAATLVNGHRGGEAPRAGWALGSAAGVLQIGLGVAGGIVTALVLLTGGVTAGTVFADVYLGMSSVMFALSAVVWLLLLAAFARGLPAGPETGVRLEPAGVPPVPAEPVRGVAR